MFNSRFLKSIAILKGSFRSGREFYHCNKEIKEATVKKWHVKEGDTVEEYQTLADVSTDKLFTQIPSAYSGKVVKIFHEEEQECQVGELFVEFDVEEGEVKSTIENKPEAKRQEETQKEEIPVANATPIDNSSDKILTSPAVRHMLKSNNLNASLIKGTGKDGRLTKEDVLNHLSKKSKPTIPNYQGRSQKNEVHEEIKIVKMSDFQKGMQKSMTISNAIPQFQLIDEIDVTDLAEIRRSIKEKTETNLSFMPFFIKTLSLSLTKFPSINSSYFPENPFEFKIYPNHNISIAIDGPKGLVVPNIKNCQTRTMEEIQEELNRLRKSSEAGRVDGKDLFDGTITISNVGSIGGKFGIPLILPPQTCIIGIGAIKKTPTYVMINGVEEVRPRQILTICITADHRVLDGGTLARFAKMWKSYLENPTLMLAYLK